MGRKQQGQSSAKLFVGVAEVADILGVHEATIRRWITSGEVPQPVRIGRTLRWERERFLAEMRTRTNGADLSDGTASGKGVTEKRK